MEKVKNGVGVDMKDSRFKYAQIAGDAYKQIPNTFDDARRLAYDVAASLGIEPKIAL